ncbi:Rapid ALkalinization Factor (RALF) [Carex littledalei]|uniref:Rapid ALkalinization Factor (RALF) n=1 Tax=Carex littledalei TaxID=544730 RepID=A0A833R9L9_9POAL|nr:Rapid ALkalinization Factor (RALF) [Carex littledalei]
MGYLSSVIITMLIAILICSAHFSEAYVDENRHLHVWNMDSEFQMDSNVHQMLLQADKSDVSYGALRNLNRPACPNRCQEPGQPYTGRPCSKVYRCSNG